ncbi:MAG: hypothetical protein U1E46_09230 [Hyphomicrobiales bacterium]
MRPHVLVLDKEFLPAFDLAIALYKAGAHVLGPFTATDLAVIRLARHRDEIAAVVMDVHLGKEDISWLAEWLILAHIPIILTTNHARTDLPASLRRTPWFPKPYRSELVASAAMQPPMALAS